MKRIICILLLVLVAAPHFVATAQDDPPTSINVIERIAYHEFSDDQLWPVGTYIWADDAYIEEGRYVVVSSDIAATIVSDTLSLDNFYAQVEVYPRVCKSGAALGLGFRINEDLSDMYYHTVECEGFFDAGVIINYEQEIKAQGALAQPLATDGTKYVMGVLADGSEITLYWNGEPIGSFVDTRRTEGEFGLRLLPIDGEPGSVEVAFDNLQVWSIESAVVEDTGAEETQPPGPPPVSDAEPQVSEEFTVPPDRAPDYDFKGGEGWAAGSAFVREDELVRATVIDGSYVITPLAGTAAIFSDVLNLTDIYAEATITIETCPESGFFGLVVRQQTTSNYYAVGLICDGTWLAARVSGQEITTLISDSLGGQPTGTHTLSVLAEGAEFNIYWDDELIGAFTDAALTEGDIGFHVQNGVGGAPIVIQIDELAIWEITPPAASAAAPTEQSSTAPPAAGGDTTAPPAAGEDESATPTPEPTSASASSEPCVAPADVGVLRYGETFEDEVYWPIGTFDFAVGEQVEGAYKLTSTDIIGTIRAVSTPVADLYAQYTVTPVQCPSNATFGLPVRISGPTWGNFYVVLMQCDGNWRISKVMTDEAGSVTGEVLAKGALGAPLETGQSYTIGVEAQGSTLSYYWNGDLLESVVDTTHLAGDFGIQIRPSVPEYQPLTILVDNYCVWKVP